MFITFPLRLHAALATTPSTIASRFIAASTAGLSVTSRTTGWVLGASWASAGRAAQNIASRSVMVRMRSLRFTHVDQRRTPANDPGLRELRPGVEGCRILDLKGCT